MQRWREWNPVYRRLRAGDGNTSQIRPGRGYAFADQHRGKGLHWHHYQSQTLLALNMRLSSRYPQSGFTLIELIFTIAIAVVLMAVAVPSFIGFQRNSELTSVTNSLISATNAARAEAMKTGMNAFVVPTANGNDWSAGWVVFVDRDRDNSYSAASDTTVLAQGAIASYLSITGTGNAALSTAPYIMFDNSGYAKSYGTTPGVPNLTLSIARNDVPSAQTATETRRVVVARTGRARSCRPTSSSDTSCSASTAD